MIWIINDNTTVDTFVGAGSKLPQYRKDHIIVFQVQFAVFCLRRLCCVNKAVFIQCVHRHTPWCIARDRKTNSDKVNNQNVRLSKFVSHGFLSPGVPIFHLISLLSSFSPFFLTLYLVPLSGNSSQKVSGGTCCLCFYRQLALA